MKIALQHAGQWDLENARSQASEWSKGIDDYIGVVLAYQIDMDRSLGPHKCLI
jgi:hypothetical protein